MRNTGAKIMLVPLESDDREQFIIDNQRAFKYGAQEEFFAEQSGKAEHGMRDDRVEEGQEVISLWNKYQHGPAVPEELEEDDGEHQSSWSEDDEMFRFQKIM